MNRHAGPGPFPGLQVQLSESGIGPLELEGPIAIVVPTILIDGVHGGHVGAEVGTT